jgi:hypothetical protein
MTDVAQLMSWCRSRRSRCLGSLIALLAVTLPAFAQHPSPQRLNDCTFLREPDQLRQCVDENKGLWQEPEVNQPAPPDALLRDAGSRPKRVPPPPLLKDEGVFNEHVEPPTLLKDEGVLK